VGYFDRKVSIPIVLGEFALDDILLAYQDNLDIHAPDRSNRPFDFRLGGVVSAHCIYRNGQHVRQMLLLLDFDYFPALVLAAVRADPVRRLRLMTIGTL
jgi:hypothetical protein